MPLLPIVKNPDSRLRVKVSDVPVLAIKSAEFQRLLDDMILTMKAANGIGLAATQIGQTENIAIVTMSHGPAALINLRITDYGKKTDELEEGCLSIPGLWGKVKRSLTVKATATTRDGRAIKISAKGLLAHIIQHEFDHLQGTLFADKALVTYAADPKKRTKV